MAERLHALLVALGCAGAAAAHAGEAIVRWDIDGKAWIYTTEATAPAGRVQAQYPGPDGKPRCCTALKAVGTGQRGDAPRPSDQLRSEPVWQYATEPADGVAPVAPGGGPLVGAAVFGTDLVLRQRGPAELALGDRAPAPVLLTCVTREGLHLLQVDGGAKRTHLYLPFGYDVKPNCSKRARALVGG